MPEGLTQVKENPGNLAATGVPEAVEGRVRPSV